MNPVGDPAGSNALSDFGWGLQGRDVLFIAEKLQNLLLEESSGKSSPRG